MKVAIIGAGPSGLVTLKYLLTAHQYLHCQPTEVRLFEARLGVGGTFFARSYEDAELVSSKQLTTFSDFRHDGDEDFLTADRYVSYLRDYCTQFKLWPHILLNVRVVSVKRRKHGGYRLSYRRGGHGERLGWDCEAVAVCSGLHEEPNIPHIPGIETVPTVMHSSEFKSRSQFGAGKTIVVVGSGETGADVAYLAVTSPTARVVMCHRDGFHFAPKRNPGPVLLPLLGRKPDPREPGIPIDVSRANLFDTTYAHPALRNHSILWDYYHYYIKALLWVSSGSTLGMDQWVGGVGAERDHPSKIFFNKSMKVCSYISQPYRPQEPGFRLWLYALRSAIVQTPVLDTKGKRVDLAPWPERIDEEGVIQFRDNGRPEFERMGRESIKPDVVVLCTGYRQSFPFLRAKQGSSLDGAVAPTSQWLASLDVRGIWNRKEPQLGFIGFVRPSLGAIPPLAEMQAQLWILQLLSPQSVPGVLRAEDEPHYQLHPPAGSRITYGVDHESYAYQLALDMDSAPGLLDVLKITVTKEDGCLWRLPIVWAFGANFNTKYRLQGPWRDPGAADLLSSSEFWNTITRRPVLFGHFAVSLLPMCLFGPLSLLVLLYVTVRGIWLRAIGGARCHKVT